MLEKCISCIRISNFFLGEDPDTPHGFHNFGARWVRLRLIWYRLPPKPKNPSYAPVFAVCIGYFMPILYGSCIMYTSSIFYLYIVVIVCN